MVISEGYRELNRKLHESKRMYGMSGRKWTPSLKHLEGLSILDYGCGKGSLAKQLREEMGWIISEYDPAIEGKDTLPEPHDVVVCTDVMEHIEPEMLDGVLDHIRSLIRVMGFFVISTRPAKKTLPDGRNAHLIIQPFDWWMDKLRERFEIIEWKTDVSGEGEFAVWVL